jgi:hypothetical protein
VLADIGDRVTNVVLGITSNSVEVVTVLIGRLGRSLLCGVSF